MKRLLFCWLFLLLLCPSPSHALMQALSTSKLTTSSDTVIQGVVTQTQSAWEGKSIVTRAKVRVDSAITGNPQGQFVTVEYPGGVVGNKGMRVSDTPTLKAGENVILFLKKGSAQGSFKVVGQAQGAYKIAPSGIATKGGFAAVGKDSIDNDLPLEILIKKIKEAGNAR